MKKIKFNDSIAGHGDPCRVGEITFGFAPEQIADVEDELANAWVASGIASFVPKDKPKAEFATAKKSETPEAPKVVTEDSTKGE